MKNTQLLIIGAVLVALYLIMKNATKAAEDKAAAKLAVPSGLAAELQQSTKLLSDRVNSFDSRLAALEASPFK